MTCKLIHGDCIEEMQKLIEEGVRVDLTVTSPPYDNLRNYNNSLNWDFDIFKQVANRLYGITADGGVVVWIVNDATIDGSETGTSFRQALYFKEIGFNLHDTMIYQKSGIPFPEQVRYYPVFEYMFILSKGKPKTIHLIADKKNVSANHLICCNERQVDGTMKQSSGRLKGKRMKEYGVRLNIWRYNTGWNNSSKDPLAFEHPATMPLQLAEDHLISWSNPNDVVLDCFMGSGTTAEAALELGRNAVGYEINPEYKELIDNKLKRAANAQLQLFNGLQ